jgi:hypothetical protein
MSLFGATSVNVCTGTSAGVSPSISTCLLTIPHTIKIYRAKHWLNH